MIDENTHALNKHLEQQEQQEIAVEHLTSAIADELEDIRKQIEALKYIARNFNGYDLSEDLQDMLSELI